MKKTKTKIEKTQLHFEREILRTLQTQELREVAGGNLPPTSDSVRACCA